MKPPSFPVAFIVSISVLATIAMTSLNSILPCGTGWASLAVLISFVIAVSSYFKTWDKRQ